MVLLGHDQIEITFITVLPYAFTQSPTDTANDIIIHNTYNAYNLSQTLKCILLSSRPSMKTVDWFATEPPTKKQAPHSQPPRPPPEPPTKKPPTKKPQHPPTQKPLQTAKPPPTGPTLLPPHLNLTFSNYSHSGVSFLLWFIARPC